MHAPKLTPHRDLRAAPPDIAAKAANGRRPRILRVITRLNVGSPSSQALYLTAELPKRGLDSRLVWGPSGQDEGPVDPPSGLPNTYLPYLARRVSPLDDVRAERELVHIMRRWRPQIVHTHMAKAGALGRLATRRAGIPLTVHTYHGHVLPFSGGPLKTKAYISLERELARRTDALVAVAPWVRDQLLDMGIGRAEQWHVVPMGVDMGPLLSARPEQRASRASLGLPQGGPIVGCVGRLVAIKDHATFFEAARLVADRHPDATFVLAGDGELREELKASAYRLLGDRVTFLGWVRDLPALYAACDVIALTSTLEGTTEVLIEASSAGLPVVATRVGDVREVVRDGNSGWLVAPGDPVAVATNISALLADPAGARRMGEEGALWVRDRFGRERQADELTGLYGHLLARKGIGRRAERVQ
jgi:glycosyltransferase involved in cell wall biosynthesis